MAVASSSSSTLGGFRFSLRGALANPVFWRGIFALVVSILLWELCSRSKQLFGVQVPWIGMVPPPSLVLKAWADVVVSLGYWQSWYLSLNRVLAGFLAAFRAHPGLAGFVASVRDAWTVVSGGPGRPAGARGLAFAYVLAVVIVGTSLTGVAAYGTAGALGFLDGDRSPSPAVLTPSPEPSPSAPPEPSLTPAPSLSDAPIESVEPSESAEPESSDDGSPSPGASSPAGPSASPKASDDHDESPSPSADDDSSAEPSRTPRPSDTPKPSDTSG